MIQLFVLPAVRTIVCCFGHINVGSSVAACLGHRPNVTITLFMRQTMQNSKMQEKQALSAKLATEKQRHTTREAQPQGVMIGGGFLALP